MTYSSCIRHPAKNRYIQVYEWMVHFCQENHCAAFILAHLLAWHDWKLRHDAYYARANNIAEMNGDGRPHDQNAFLFFTMEELEDGILKTYSKNSIKDALNFLVNLGLISIHKNPNPRYYFDKTRYFRFYPQVCNVWIDKNYTHDTENEVNAMQVVDNYDNSKMRDALTKIDQPSAKIGKPSVKIGRPITDTTYNTTNKYQSINAREEINDESENNQRSLSDIQLILDTLQEKGLPANKLYPDTLQTIQRLKQSGATSTSFDKAYDIAVHATQGRGFGMNYLAKVVERVLAEHKSIQTRAGRSPPSGKDVFTEVVYESDMRNAMKWFKETEGKEK